MLHRFNELEFLVQVGEYRAGADPRSDAALAGIEDLRGLLRQDPVEQTPWEETLAWLARLAR